MTRLRKRRWNYVKKKDTFNTVIPAQAGIQSEERFPQCGAKPKAYLINPLDSRFRGNDEAGKFEVTL
jgi:hypothetical protein